MKTNKVLIIGGAGFLGKSVINFFKKKKVDFMYADLNPIKNFNQNFIHLDIIKTNKSLIDNYHFDIIINLTGQLTKETYKCFNLNTTGIDNLINLCSFQKSKLIHISTLSVLGSSKSIVNEETNVNPSSVYATLKSVAEYKLKSCFNKNDMIILRLCNLYGNNQSKGIINYIIENLRADKIKINNNGLLKRFFINVDDVSALLYKMIKNFQPGIYNLATKDKFTIKELISLIENIAQTKINCEYEDKEPWENIEKVDTSKVTKTYNISLNSKLKFWLTKKIND